MGNERVNKDVTPVVVTFRPGEIGALITEWRKANPGVNFTWMLKQALKAHLKPYAGKRHAHLYQ